jgi:hypothetical protein
VIPTNALADTLPAAGAVVPELVVVVVEEGFWSQKMRAGWLMIVSALQVPPAI